jgi:hypothetical protein
MEGVCHNIVAMRNCNRKGVRCGGHFEGRAPKRLSGSKASEAAINRRRRCDAEILRRRRLLSATALLPLFRAFAHCIWCGAAYCKQATIRRRMPSLGVSSLDSGRFRAVFFCQEACCRRRPSNNKRERRFWPPAIIRLKSESRPNTSVIIARDSANFGALLSSTPL